MKSTHTNQLLAAILVALLTERVTALLGTHLVTPQALDRPSYIVEGVSQKPASEGSSAPQEPLPLSPLMANANPQNGQKIAKKCLQCHVFEKNGPHKIGPRLYNVYGQKIGGQSDYAYSKAMKEKGGTWDLEALNVYLHKPRSFVPNTKMAFAGLEKASDRADIVAYLQTLHD